MSKFYGIGVGPGNPELLTLKAVRVLQEIHVLIVPYGGHEGESEALNIVSSHIPSHVVIQRRHFPMTRDKSLKEAAWQSIADEIVSYVKDGQSVGFITLGDPMLYSTYGYLVTRLSKRLEIVTVPGISAYSAIASGFNLILAEGDTPLMIYPCVESMDAIEKCLSEHDSIVLMKVYRSFETVKALINKLELTECALVVSDYGRPSEVHFTDINAVDTKTLSYFTTIIINKRWVR